jgi:hemerythrin-like domain-containing protein
VKSSKRPAAKRPAAKRTAKAVSQRAARVSGTAKTAAKKAAKKSAATRRPARASSVDAIALLKRDHREVEQMFKRFERAGDGAVKAKGQLVAAMIEALSRHAEIEELILYPAVREQLPRSGSDVLEALEEHHVVKVVLRELEGLDPTAERFDAKVAVMMELVRHHVREEESSLFPKVRAKVGRRELLDMGDQLRRAKGVVPTRPHPGAPDEPPGNVVAGAAVAILDKARTAGKRAVDRVREEI